MRESNKHNHAKIDSDPVLLFEIPSSGSYPPVELMTVADAASLLKISKSGIRRLQQARHLPFIKIGNCVRFSRRDLLHFLERSRVGPIDT